MGTATTSIYAAATEALRCVHQAKICLNAALGHAAVSQTGLASATLLTLLLRQALAAAATALRHTLLQAADTTI